MEKANASSEAPASAPAAKRYVRLENMKLTGHIALLGVGLLGVVLGTLPDLSSQDLSMIPPFAHYDDGIRVLETIHDGSNRSILNPGMKGHRAIYQLLRSYDPSTIPTPSKSLFLAGRGAIVSVRSGQSWNLNFQEAPSRHIDAARYIVVQDAKGIFQPIIEGKDLKGLIRDAKVRFCSRVGFALTLLVMFTEFLVAVREMKRNEPNQAL